MQSTIKHHYNNIKKYFIKELKNKKYRKAILLINSVINLPKKYGAIYQRREKRHLDLIFPSSLIIS